MKKYLLSVFLFAASLTPGTANSQLLEGYNTQFYNTVLEAAHGIAMPFLLQQGFTTLAGVEIYEDTLLYYNGVNYPVRNKYQNPVSGNGNGYYILNSEYGNYGIEIFRNPWPLDIPNVFFNPSQNAFYSYADCVGYGTRLLSATGDTTEERNAYLNLIKTVKSANTTMMAIRGYVASAYEIGAAFPTLPTSNPGGWQYISGNVISDSINAYNRRIHPNLNLYNGQPKGAYGESMPGDILAFSYAPGGESNGHFMVMSDTPYLIGIDTIRHFYPQVPVNDIQNFLNTYDVYATPVYDCSGQTAHFHDSRNLTSGVGHGTLWILTEPLSGIPLGFIFKAPSPNTTIINAQLLNNEHTWAISVGRFNPKITGTGYIEATEHPSALLLGQNYPNPFNPSTKISYQVSKPGFVSLTIFDVLGKHVASPVSREMKPGFYEVTWDAAIYPSGVYFYTLVAGNVRESRRMILLR